jgi:hypothetical protein
MEMIIYCGEEKGSGTIGEIEIDKGSGGLRVTLVKN